MKNNTALYANRWRPSLLRHLLLGAGLFLALFVLLAPRAQAAGFPTVPLTQDGRAVLDGQSYLIEGVTYVPFRAFCELQGCGTVGWDAASRTAYAVTKNGTHIYAHADGALYIRYGERYFYTTSPVRLVNDRLYIPIRPLAKCFGLDVAWSAKTRSVALQSTGGSVRDDVGVYASDELYWLARIIQAEAGGESLKGKLAVGNVVLNRVASPIFPNSIHGVLAQKNQFSTYKGGKLANRTPNEGSVIAAKLVLDGGVVEEVENALWFDAKCSNSWAARHKTCLAVIGGHKFYG